MDIIGIIFIIYLMFLIGVGIWTYTYNKTQETLIELKNNNDEI